MNTKKYENDQIRKLLDKNLPQAPQNEWFIRKTINRLPDKNRSTISIIEHTSYIIALLIVLIFDCVIGYNIVKTGLITINNIICIFSLNIFLLAIIFAVLKPYFRNEFD